MPRFDGTGPLGQGPMTGRGMGFCVLKESQGNPDQIEGFSGIEGRPINEVDKNGFPGKEVIDMPFGDRTGPAGLGPMTGRAAGFCACYPAPGYVNPSGFSGFAALTGAPSVSPYTLTPYGYRLPYPFVRPWYGRGFGRFGFGRRFGRGRGQGRGRGRFGFCW